MTEHQNCCYKFWRWLFALAIKHKKIYWLLWGMILALCLAGRDVLSWLGL
ncbi:MAG: hypothetical protein J6K16_00510 [Alphaproteobacteria bacterium]|nr:hypothetical protein [Alphaproteobacteria bacterium]